MDKRKFTGNQMSHAAVLTPVEAQEVRKTYNKHNRNTTIRALAQRFKCSPSTICNIIHGRSYSHLWEASKGE